VAPTDFSVTANNFAFIHGTIYKAAGIESYYYILLNYLLLTVNVPSELYDYFMNVELSSLIYSGGRFGKLKQSHQTII
jgi:hypothetical protein